jgi:hypothetical protein
MARGGFAENNESNESINVWEMRSLFPGILTLPIIMANPPLDPDGSIKSTIICLFCGYNPSRYPGPVHPGAADF